jgi:hypothetical protein
MSARLIARRDRSATPRGLESTASPRGVERELGSFRLVDVESHATRQMGGVGSGLQDGPPSGVLDDSNELVGLGLTAEANARRR